MWASMESKPRPIVTTETCVPPASRQELISAARSSRFDPLNATNSPPNSSADRPSSVTRSRCRFHASMAWSVPPPMKMKPSASRAARSNAASPPPIQIGTGRVGFGTSAGAVDPIEAAREVDNRFGEQPAKQLDLFLLACPSGTKVLSQGFVLDLAPADANAQSKPTSRQQVDISGLACHERRLTLRQDQDSRGEPDALGDASQISEHHERVVKRILLRVRAWQPRRSVGVDRTQDVVVGKEVIETQILDCPPNPSNCDWIASKLDLGVHDADVHLATLPHESGLPSRGPRHRRERSGPFPQASGSSTPPPPCSASSVDMEACPPIRSIAIDGDRSGREVDDFGLRPAPLASIETVVRAVATQRPRSHDVHDDEKAAAVLATTTDSGSA